MTIFNRTEIHLDFMDRIRVLFGKTIHLYTDIEVSAEVDLLDTRQSVHVDPFIKPKQVGEAALDVCDNMMTGANSGAKITGNVADKKTRFEI